MPAYQESVKKLEDRPDCFEVIFAHLANGGDPFSLCELLGVNYAHFNYWIQRDPRRRKLLEEAYMRQKDWIINRFLAEIKAISFLKVTDIFEKDGTIKPVDQWPENACASLDGMEVIETFDDDGNKTGYVKKVKFNSKLKAIELLGRDLGRFVQAVEVTGKITLEDLINNSRLPSESIN